MLANRSNDRESRYFRLANSTILVAEAVFVLFRALVSLSYGHVREAGISLVAGAITFVALLLLSRRRGKGSTAFFMPMLLFVAYTATAFAVQNFSYFFSVYFAISCAGALYLNKRNFLAFLLLTNVFNLVLALHGMPVVRGGAHFTEFPEIAIDWALTLFGSVLLYRLSSLGSDKTASATRAQDSFATLMRTTPNLMALVDEMNRVMYISKPLANLAHFERAEIAVDRPLIDLFHDREIKVMISEVLESEGLYEATKMMLIDGRTRYFKITSDKLVGGAQQGTFIDITDVTQIMEARFEAETASRIKSEFLANMSHEIRTPINAIIGMGAIAKNTEDPKRKDYCLEKIEDASTHLLGVINDILDISKIEAGKLELAPEDFNFEKMLQKVVNVISFRAEERQQSFTVYIDSLIPSSLVGDDQRLAQVVANLLSNAIKFTPEEGSVRLDARLVLDEDEDGACVIQISVNDTGIGISPEQQSRLFSSFQQAESTTSRRFGGTGLGLAISKGIVEMMGGKIWVESDGENGSTFAFNVHLKRSGDERKSLLSPGVNRKNLRVLTVDDEPETLEYFADIMQRLDILCDTAASADEALARIAEGGKYDIYFIDWNMPRINGIELTRELRQSNARDFVVIMISATEWEVIEKEAKAVGVDRFLQKPLFPSDIANCINEYIGVDDAVAAETQQEDDAGIFAGSRILLTDDIEINREIVMALLEPTGIAIDCAENGVEALSLFEADPESYDLILMDVQMPEMDGLEATRRIRAMDLPKAQAIPIVAMTANVFREDIEMCLAAGMNDHLGKPLDFDKMMACLRGYLGTV
ncbi:MAG: response regulator [Clostridiales Family XIII bacterium]|jgi:signal transduction histidine kinase/DNA-binding response OmpR family regulator|nr:response regulator [Clostridiales Family XIII bacterium]